MLRLYAGQFYDLIWAHVFEQVWYVRKRFARAPVRFVVGVCSNDGTTPHIADPGDPRSTADCVVATSWLPLIAGARWARIGTAPTKFKDGGLSIHRGDECDLALEPHRLPVPIYPKKSASSTVWRTVAGIFGFVDLDAVLTDGANHAYEHIVPILKECGLKELSPEELLEPENAVTVPANRGDCNPLEVGWGRVAVVAGISSVVVACYAYAWARFMKQ